MRTREEKLAYGREWRRQRKEQDPNCWKKHYQTYREDSIQRSCQHFLDNREEVTEYYREYRKDPTKQKALKANAKRFRKSAQGKLLARMGAAERRTSMNRKVSRFHKEELRQIYANCPKGMVVDHIHPINHPLVCGLHVPANLQYLTPEENSKKSNIFESYNEDL